MKKNKLQEFLNVVEGLGQGVSASAFYAEGFSKAEIEEWAKEYPYKVYIHDECVYTDEVRISYWKYKDGVELSEREKELLEKYYGVTA